MARMCQISATGYPTAVTEPLSNCARFAARPVAEGGTPAAEWAEWCPHFAPLRIEDCPALLLVAAHPDDETLGFGATAVALAARGVTVQVVCATDGEAAYPDEPGVRAHMALRRRHELVAATDRLGLPDPIFLGIPDGDVTAHEDRLCDEVATLLAVSPPGTWCAATWRGDGHPDHEATGRAAAAAVGDGPRMLVEYPIWMWHWAVPDDQAVPWERALRSPLSDRDAVTKSAALQCFSSQLSHDDGPPVLAPEMVARQLAVGEIVFV